eukprot:TRINITY_DN19997_c0_g1_i1.p1 TRINITY_DN19997_c0_g1~~TRINITY_DN19997_c0_g1_i1.p1  ORF type:complete len:131 (+),score=30.59 TRINITY_DN19997_c0_g1_i1:21-413(+)
MLLQVVDAIELSRVTLRKIKQNLWWAFMYNIVGLPLAAGVLLPVTNTMLTPSIAGALMGVSSLGVMANSLLLQWEYDRSSGALLKSSKSSPPERISVASNHSPEAGKERSDEDDMEKGLLTQQGRGKFAH